MRKWLGCLLVGLVSAGWVVPLIAAADFTVMGVRTFNNPRVWVESPGGPPFESEKLAYFFFIIAMTWLGVVVFGWTVFAARMLANRKVAES